MFAAEVTLLYVLEPSYSGFDVLARPVPDIEEDRRTVASAKLETYLSHDFPSRKVSRLLVAGEAAAQIAEVARRDGFDMIVMPTHTGAFRRMLLGSTTAKVLNDADCMVLTTQHAERIKPRPLLHREWVCAIGLSADSSRVLSIASNLAKTAGANLTLIHAIPQLQPGLPLQLDLEERLQSKEQKAARAQVHELQRLAGSNARAHIAVGQIKAALTETARWLEADALVIGRSSQPGTQGRLRDLTYAVVRDAPCPVISI